MAVVGEMIYESAEAPSTGRLTRDERKWSWIGTLIAVVVFVLLATWGQPWNIFQKGPYSSDFYDAQAQSIVRGHLDIPGKIAGIEGISVGGKTQIYFGVGPAIIRLPLSGWIDGLTGRLGILSMTIAVGVLGLAAARLLGRSRKLVSPGAVLAPLWFGVMAAAASICTPVLFLASRSTVYHEAIIWGCAASLAGLDLVLRWWREPTRRRFVAAVVVAAFAVSCRITPGIAPAFAIGFFGVVLAFRRQWLGALTAVVGVLVALLGFALFNWLRFRSLFSVSNEDQVYSQIDEARKQFLAANNGRIVGPQFLPTTILRYFSPFAMDWQRMFPFVNFGPLQRPVGGVVFDGGSGQSSSIVLGAPVFFIFAVIGAWWTAKSDQTRQWFVLAAAAVIATFGTLAFGSIQHRYLVDLVPAVIVLACPGVWVLSKRWVGFSNLTRRSLAAIAVVLSLFGMWLQFGLALENRAFVMNPIASETRSIVALQNAIDQRLFESPPLNIKQLFGEELPREGNVDGEFVILDDCAGLYRFSALSKWVVVERKLGGGRQFLLTGTLGAGSTPLMTGWGWTLTANRSPDGVVFVYDKSDGYQTKSTATALPDGPLTLEVVADQSQYGVLSIRNSDSTLFEELGLGVQYPEPAPGWTSTPGSAPLCESLLSRIKE
ncbi:MAG: hypothetical protein LW869_06335 [Actinobacteria bacterium]|nr:hypothetical protein [Actinomycetota bacterium]